MYAVENKMPLKVIAKVAVGAECHYDVEALCLKDDYLLSTSDDGKVKVWKTDNLELVTEVLTHLGASAYDVACCGDKVYTCGNDGKLKVWSYEDWSLIKEVLSVESPLRKICVSNGRVFTGDEEGHVYAIKGEDDTFISKFEMVEEVWDLKMRDGDLFTVRDRGLTVSNIHEHPTCLKSTVRKSLPGSAPICISKDFLFMKSVDGHGVDCWKSEGRDFKKVATVKGPERIITAISVSPDGQRLYAAGWDNKLLVWSVGSFELEDTVDLPDCASAIVVSPCGAVFVGGTDGFIVKVNNS